MYHTVSLSEVAPEDITKLQNHNQDGWIQAVSNFALYHEGERFSFLFFSLVKDGSELNKVGRC